ncbi:MAG: EamA family transporter [Azospirillum sp.]|nr:EamA family transporter [Azospirillum sp.]
MSVVAASAVTATDRGSIRRATAVGAVAIVMWSTLAMLTTLSGAVPPFQLVAMAFTVAFLVGSLTAALRGRGAFQHFRQPTAAWLLGVGGLFGYHFCYFLALRLAPPVEANLLNYLWPLLIVLFSGLLPGERLGWPHALGALSGLAGTVLLVTGGGAVAIRPEFLAGYASALACGVIWSGYSVLNRRFGEVPTEAVGAFCLATAVLAALCHALFETTVTPEGWQWLAILAMGLGPVGAAFFVWDYGCKHGDIRSLGVLAYATPMLSTLLLIVSGRAQQNWVVWTACALIVGGAVLASRDLFKGGSAPL